MTTHTSGPWCIHDAYKNNKPFDVVSTDGHTYQAFSLRISQGDKLVCEVTSSTHSAGFPMVDNETEARANAILIAAAPELLAIVKELKECSNYWSDYDVPIGIVDRLHEIIAKAEGKA